MTLRRCDSLPTRLRKGPAPADETHPLDQKLPDSSTVPNFQDTPDRELVVAKWNSLHKDVKNIKNGTPAKNEPVNREENKKESITHCRIPASSNASNNRQVRKKITYDARVTTREAAASSSFPLDTGQAGAVERGAAARRRTLLQRLLSWKTPECDCPQRFRRKLRPEDLLCTCGSSSATRAPTDKNTKISDRVRSKSVGYEAAREVAQFRRLVQCDE